MAPETQVSFIWTILAPIGGLATVIFGTLGFITKAQNTRMKATEEKIDSHIEHAVGFYVPRTEWKLGQDSIIRELEGINKWLEGIEDKMN